MTNDRVDINEKSISEHMIQNYMKVQFPYSKTQDTDTYIEEIVPYIFRKCDREKKRINLLLPSINPEHVFGGIWTAIKFFEKLAYHTGYDKRIILTDSQPTQEAVEQYKESYEFVEWNKDSAAESQIVPYSERYYRNIPVSDKDYFVFTGWWTAHCAHEAYEQFELIEGITPNPFIYLIQDFEPGFYAWSTRYVLAESTYRNRYPQIAVFNTELLQEYFHINGFTFFKEFAFNPVLNTGLKKKLYEINNSIHKKKQILIYGRPGTERNAFKLIVAVLRKWVTIQEDISEWNILSAGEKHEDIDLGKEKKLISLGKLTIEEYAEVLKDSYAGISLMVSPHPSYPPLEMSVFGVNVITNIFANKDLKGFNDHVISVHDLNPCQIAVTLKKICDDYKMIIPHKIANDTYCDNPEVFGFIEQMMRYL